MASRAVAVNEIAVLGEFNSAGMPDATRVWKSQESRSPNLAPEIAPGDQDRDQVAFQLR